MFLLIVIIALLYFVYRYGCIMGDCFRVGGSEVGESIGSTKDIVRRQR